MKYDQKLRVPTIPCPQTGVGGLSSKIRARVEAETRGATPFQRRPPVPSLGTSVLQQFPDGSNFFREVVKLGQAGHEVPTQCGVRNRNPNAVFVRMWPQQSHAPEEQDICAMRDVACRNDGKYRARNQAGSDRDLLKFKSLPLRKNAQGNWRLCWHVYNSDQFAGLSKSTAN